jgi:Tc toxin complex TcA C-terminal TcB-binding domain
MSGEISTVYFQAYQMAYDLAKKAEKAFRFERGLVDSNFIQFGYWDSLRQGLLAGEQLHLALKRLEIAYHDQNKREYEITRHVSLQLFDLVALIALKQTGQCEVFLPELLFDADYSGHYMRRLKSVGITLPCVVGPYTNINCTLTLLSNKTRVNAVVGNQYEESTDEEDDRFVSNFAAVQSIATSHAQNDSGLFELNFRDERYLPFEGAGVISRWRIELPRDTNAFDLNTLTDVVMHLKYTARDGGDILKNAARKARNDAIADADSAPLMRFFSGSHEFPDEWYRFLHPIDQNASSQTMTLDLSSERFPYLFRGRTLSFSRLEVFLIFKNFKDNSVYAGGTPLPLTITPDGQTAISDQLNSNTAEFAGTPHTQFTLDLTVPTKIALEARESDIKNIAQTLTEAVPPTPPNHIRLKADAVEDLLFVAHYSVKK